MGNYLADMAAANGANFISPEIAKLVRREVAYREDGALIDDTRDRALPNSVCAVEE